MIQTCTVELLVACRRQEVGPLRARMPHSVALPSGSCCASGKGVDPRLAVTLTEGASEAELAPAQTEGTQLVECFGAPALKRAHKRLIRRLYEHV